MTRMAAKTVLVTAVLSLIGGLVVAVVADPREVAPLFFGIGVALFGVNSLLVGRDRTIAWELIFAGILPGVADLIRLLLVLA